MVLPGEEAQRITKGDTQCSVRNNVTRLLQNQGICSF